MGWLWFSGAEPTAIQLHLHAANGRKIVVHENMNYHLLWDQKDNIYVKPVSRYLLCSSFWKEHLRCPTDCPCTQEPTSNCGSIRGVAFGFLYTYLSLISSEIDFRIANEKYLLPRKKDGSTIEWEKWKALSREVIRQYDLKKVHPRFLNAEVRVSSVYAADTAGSLQLYNPYVPGLYRTIASFRIGLATAAVFIALVLTAMQVGLATDRLKDDADFQQASYGFTVFAILGPICTYGLILLLWMLRIIRHFPWYIRQRKRTMPQRRNRRNETVVAQPGSMNIV